jgi:hypothetical protein
MLAAFALLLASCSLGSSSSVFDLEPGECFDEPSAGEISDLPMVDCADPHGYEAFAIFEVADGPFPGVAALEDAATACLPLFEDYVGTSYESAANLDIMYFPPSAESWDAGDREIICTLYDLNGNQLTGSQRNAGA